MKNIFYYIGYLVIISVIPAEQVMANGQDLHSKNCVACHSTEVYTRTNKKVKSLASLERQVNRCTQAAGVKWTDQQIMDVVNYLNTNYYKY